MFLASLQATVLEQKVGKVPDGWRVVIGASTKDASQAPASTASFWRDRAIGCASARTAWAVVDVRARACKRPTAARIAATHYGGVLDLGSDGYDRALRGDFVPFPPLAVAPTFETPDYRLSWLNRLQCLGVGRVDTTGKRYDFDVYAVEVGDRALKNSPDFPRAARIARRRTPGARKDLSGRRRFSQLRREGERHGVW